MTEVIPPKSSVPGCPAETLGDSTPLTRAADDRRTIATLTGVAARAEAERESERLSALLREKRLAELFDGLSELLRAFTVTPAGAVARISPVMLRRLTRLVVEQEPDEEAA